MHVGTTVSPGVVWGGRRFPLPGGAEVVGTVGWCSAGDGEGAQPVDAVAYEVGPGVVVGEVEQDASAGAGQGRGEGE